MPAGLSDDALVRVRSRFLMSGNTNVAASDEIGAGVDPVNDLRRWRAAIADHHSYDELILWFEHDLFDQLNLIQLLSWIHEHVPPTKPVSLICIGSFPGRPDFKGLGELTPAELAPLLETRQPVSESQYTLAKRTWTAFRERTPGALDKLRRDHIAALPYLAGALTRFLQEYPWIRDGLSRTERRLLEVAGSGISLRDAYPRMHDGEDAYYISVETFRELAEQLSAQTPPLLSLDEPAGEGRRGMPTIRLTTSGQAVLAGELDRVAACGIERWLGGVHLQGRTVPWRWSQADARIVRV